MGMREAYQDKSESQLREWDAEIEKLKAKADKADAESRIKYYEELEDLHTKRSRIANRLREMKEAGEDKWEDFKVEVERAWDDMRNSLQRASSRISGRST